MKIAIMQPYFLPYAGYFRLFCSTDLFVVYDCVQFPRRSWVHRNRIFNNAKELDWVTLPIQKQSQNVLIKDLKFRDTAIFEWETHLLRFSGLEVIKKKYPGLFAAILNINIKPIEYIVNCLCEICYILDIHFNITYSSYLEVPTDVKGQDRIFAIAKHYHATDYINAPGGHALYQESDFLNNGLRLHFLPEYKGEFHSIIQCLMDQKPAELKKMLMLQSMF